MLGNFGHFLSSADFFQNKRSEKKYNQIDSVKQFGPRSGPTNCQPDVGPKCLQRLSADDTSRQKVNGSTCTCFLS